MEQQANLIRLYISNDYNVVQSTAGETNGYSILINYDVAVMTPQLLLNILNKSVTTRCCISEFTLILFDECHHSNKKHPYNEIMEIYFEMKFSSKNAKLPQVIRQLHKIYYTYSINFWIKN